MYDQPQAYRPSAPPLSEANQLLPVLGARPGVTQRRPDLERTPETIVPDHRRNVTKDCSMGWIKWTLSVLVCAVVLGHIVDVPTTTHELKKRVATAVFGSPTTELVGPPGLVPVVVTADRVRTILQRSAPAATIALSWPKYRLPAAQTVDRMLASDPPRDRADHALAAALYGTLRSAATVAPQAVALATGGNTTHPKTFVVVVTDQFRVVAVDPLANIRQDLEDFPYAVGAAVF